MESPSNQLPRLLLGVGRAAVDFAGRAPRDPRRAGAAAPPRCLADAGGDRARRAARTRRSRLPDIAKAAGGRLAPRLEGRGRERHRRGAREQEGPDVDAPGTAPRARRRRIGRAGSGLGRGDRGDLRVRRAQRREPRGRDPRTGVRRRRRRPAVRVVRGARALPVGPGERAREPAQRRRGHSQLRRSPVSERSASPADARPERRDARPHGLDRQARARLVSGSRDRGRARLDARDAERRARRPRGV